MARAENAELIDIFDEFYRDHYHDEISELATRYPEQRSLFIDWDDLSQFDSDLADDYRSHPEQVRQYAEEALRLYNLPIDVGLGRAHVRIRGFEEVTEIQKIRARHRGKLLAIQGIIRQATDVRQKITEAAFECQRCGTLTRIPQPIEEFQKPHECQGCERKGPLEINTEQSEFVDSQTLHIVDDPKNRSEGTLSQDIEILIEDDLVGKAAAGERVRINGVLNLDQKRGDEQDESTFGYYVSGISLELLEGTQSARIRSDSESLIDLEIYIDFAATAVSTLPEDAREEETKAKLVTPFIEALGWNKYDGTEVRLEYTDPKTTLRPDYALFGPDSESPDVIVEAKHFGTNLRKHEGQLYDYLRVFSARWGILTNGEEFHVYRCGNGEHLPEKLAAMQIEDLSRATIVDSLRRNAFYK